MIAHFRFNNWAEGQPGGEDECMGYSDEHEFLWDDFQCDNNVEPFYIYAYICEADPLWWK